MSRQLVVDEWALRLCARTDGGYWVRLRRNGRVLGTLTKVRGKWDWAVWPGAFRGDGRAATRSDGDPTDQVPTELLTSGRTITQVDACSDLMEHLCAYKAPVLGHGPHKDVTSRLVKDGS